MRKVQGSMAGDVPVAGLASVQPGQKRTPSHLNSCGFSFSYLIGLLALSVCVVPAALFGREPAAPVSRLIEQLQSEDGEQSRRAAYALGKLGVEAKDAADALAVAMDGRQQELRWYAVDALGRIGPDAAASVPAILQAIQDPANDESFRRAAVRALGRIGEQAAPAVPLLIEALKANDGVLRVEAAMALWHIGRHERAIPALIDSARQGGREAAFEAVLALDEVGADSPRTVETLVRSLGHRDADVRRASAVALGRLGLDVAEAVCDAMGRRPPIDRKIAAMALGRMGDRCRRDVFYAVNASPEEFSAAAGIVVRHILPALVKLLAGSQVATREVAADSAARFGLAAVPALLAALRDGQPTTRAAAARALVELENYLPAPTSESRGAAAIKSKLVVPLIVAMRHADTGVRAPAFRLFAALKFGPEGDEALAVLREGLRDEDVSIRRNAATAIQRMKPK